MGPLPVYATVESQPPALFMRGEGIQETTIDYLRVRLDGGLRQWHNYNGAGGGAVAPGRTAKGR